ncbi:hypothetical protein D3C86_2245550 [compost metagenome]
MRPSSSPANTTPLRVMAMVSVSTPPISTSSHWAKLVVSHWRTVPSSLLEIRRLPSGDQTTEITSAW